MSALIKKKFSFQLDETQEKRQEKLKNQQRELLQKIDEEQPLVCPSYSSFMRAHTLVVLLFGLLFTLFPSLMPSVFLTAAPATIGARLRRRARALTRGDLLLPAGRAREQRPAQRCPVGPTIQPQQCWLGPTLQLQHAPFQLALSQLKPG